MWDRMTFHPEDLGKLDSVFFLATMEIPTFPGLGLHSGFKVSSTELSNVCLFVCLPLSLSLSIQLFLPPSLQDIIIAIIKYFAFNYVVTISTVYNSSIYFHIPILFSFCPDNFFNSSCSGHWSIIV